jgi:phosphoserine phosphatase
LIFFTRRVAIQAGFHEDRANRFVVEDGHLTGAVREPILGREAKLATLVRRPIGWASTSPDRRHRRRRRMTWP